MTIPTDRVGVVDQPVTGSRPTPPATRVERRADRDRSKRKRRWWIGAVVAVVVGVVAATAVVVGVRSKAAPPAAPPKPLPLPPAASASAPATIFSQGELVSDPTVMVDGGHNYLYGTGGAKYVRPHVPVRVMNGTTTLTQATDAMPTLPTWSWGWIWAPDVAKAGNHYVMWFTTQDIHRTNPDGLDSQCIGNATSDSPLGPFTPGPAPVICQRWGDIDPRTFTDADGSHWLLWKSDTNADHTQVLPTTIWSQRLADNGTTLLGKRIQIAVATQPWEQALIEAPDMVLSGGKYYLFFSGASSAVSWAGIGYETCKGVRGPCTDTRTAPFLASNAQGNGPSEESLFTQNGVTWLMYTPTAIYQPFQYPYLAIARVAFGPTGPYLAAFDGKNPGHG
jgi:Glycosyl hydrolases family 43